MVLVHFLALESRTVLWGQTIIYTGYVLIILALMAWFAFAVTRSGSKKPVPPRLFYSFAALLVVVGVSIHLVTYSTIPWVRTELHRGDHPPVETYELTVGDHEWSLPAMPMEVPCGEMVQFSVETTDLTYGFGVFDTDGFMVMQMQVTPGHANDILWEFSSDGSYTIRSTEYSGPLGADMVVHDAIHVTGCDSGGQALEGSNQ